MLEFSPQREKIPLTATFHIHMLRCQINRQRSLHATDIRGEISSFGAAINSSLQQCYSGLSPGGPASFRPISSVRLHHATGRNSHR